MRAFDILPNAVYKRVVYMNNSMTKYVL